ncbi:O-antigen ligase family protein [Marinilactibacillus psychrotolerans]|uniref:O-antigen ligase family protein n=1 Tax=Marinilactibacillus psychrotolerans TaxID=191770 RepID=UPI003888F418
MQRKDINAILLAVYMWMFIILRVVWKFSDKYSTIILGGIAVTIIITSMIKSNRYLNKSFFKGFILISLFLFILLVNVLLHNNDVILTRMYEFIIYGAIPIVLLSQITDFEPFFKTYVYMSIFVFLLYVTDPLNQYYFSTSYMVYGYQAILPAFFGLHIGRTKYKYKFLLILEIISIIMLIAFGNRMASISALLFVFVVDILYTKMTIKKLFKYFSLSIIGFSLIMNIQNIISLIIEYLFSKGYSSYSLNATLFYLDGRMDSFSAGRNEIWQYAFDLIQKKPITGYGIGYFESIYGNYVHNIFLDVALSLGVIGMFVLVGVLINSIYKLRTTDSNARLFGILLLCTSFPKLLTSIYFYIEPTFWLLLFYGIFVPQCLKINKTHMLKEGNTDENLYQ